MGEKLLNYLVSHGYLSREIADQLHKEHLENGRTIRELVVEQGSVSEDHLLEALSSISRMPIIRLYEQQIPMEVRQLVKADLLRSHVVMPFGFDPDDPGILWWL